MPYTTLLFDLADGIATITVNRPDKLNALNATVIAELDDAASRASREPEIRGVLLTGAGPKAFVAGADISEIGGQGAHEGQARALAGQRMMRRFERCGKPVVAAVNGFALGGGCELAMACHLRIASDTARFGQPEVKLGIGPGYGGTVRLPRLVGRGRALELLLTGAMLVLQLGLADLSSWHLGERGLHRGIAADLRLGLETRLGFFHRERILTLAYRSNRDGLRRRPGSRRQEQESNERGHFVTSTMYVVPHEH